MKKGKSDFFKNEPNQNYNLLTEKSLGIANKRAPVKKKFVRGNNAPFMNREFQKETYVSGRLRNKYLVLPSAENKAAYKNRETRRKSIRRYMDKISEKVTETNKSFWNFVKPFMTNKGMVASNDLILIDGKNVIAGDNQFYRHLTSTILTLSKKVAEKNLII